MIGLMLNEKELCEIEYLLKREMEEILFDMGDDRIEQVIKNSMCERYKILFALFKRVAPETEFIKFLPPKSDG